MSRFAAFAAVGIVGVLLGGAARAADPQPAQGSSTTMHAPVAKPFGTLPDGRTVNLWTLEVPGGWKAAVSEYGAILTSLHVPAKEAGKALGETPKSFRIIISAKRTSGLARSI
jgi:hypothetical protein